MGVGRRRLTRCRNGVVFTFRTSFNLKGMRPSTAFLHGRFVADNHVRAIRLNGHEVSVPRHGYEEFGYFHGFSSDRGFVEGLNVLEIDVENGIPGRMLRSPIPWAYSWNWRARLYRHGLSLPRTYLMQIRNRRNPRTERIVT